MFYFEKINGRNILKSDLLKDVQAFFTTRDICICDKGLPTLLQGAREISDNKKSSQII